MRYRKWVLSSILILLLLLAAGCQTLSYYKQAIAGQIQMLSNREPIKKLLADPDTSPEMKKKFRLILDLRKFAKEELSLAPGKRYLTYVDLHRSNAVWNVYAAPEFSLKPKTWWFPIVGSVSYRGYFSEPAARAYANKLREKGYDVYVGGVDAYSTLGWFNDPVLNTFIGEPERSLASLIFHELTHQRLFISGDTEFNEALATAVAEEGLRRWLVEKSEPAALEKFHVALKRKKKFLELIANTRSRLKALYQTACEDSNDVALRKQKEKIMDDLRESYARLKKEWNGYAGYDDWFDGPLNNAQLNTVATYYDLVPVFRKMIDDDGGDMSRFFKDAKKFAVMSKKKRHRILEKMKLRLTRSAGLQPDS